MVLRSPAVRPVLGLILLATFLALPTFGVTRELTRNFPLHPDGTFELSNVNGTVRIESWDKDEVEVHAIKTSPDTASVLDLVSIDIEARPDSVTVSTRYPQEVGVEVAIDYLVRVPRTIQLTRVSNINGSLRVVAVELVGELRTVNGNIEVFEGSGNVHARTTNGNVYVELKRPRDNRGVSAETTNGSVLLAIPTDLPAALEARCMNGNFSTDLPVLMETAQQPRLLHGRLGPGSVPIRLATVNGTIRVVALHSTV